MPEQFSPSKVESLLYEATANSVLVRRAYEDMKRRQVKIKVEQDRLLLMLAIDSDKLLVDKSGDGLARQVRARLEIDEVALKSFNTQIASSVSLSQIPFEIRNHKMLEIIQGTREFFGADESVIATLVSGKLPIGIDNNPAVTPFLMEDRPEGSNFWGTSIVSYLSNALVTLNFTAQNVCLQTLPTAARLDLFQNSALFRLSLLPKDLQVIRDYSYSYLQEDSNYFGFIHSGYAFGGQRESKRQDDYGPEDCSSWVAKMTGSKLLYSTINQLYTFRSQVSGLWNMAEVNRDEYDVMNTLYSPVTSAEQIRPGDIYFIRTFKKEAGPSVQQEGYAGHTGILFTKDDMRRELYYLGFNRNMPNCEGFGIERSSMDPPPTEKAEKVVAFLRPRSAAEEVASSWLMLSAAELVKTGSWTPSLFVSSPAAGESSDMVSQSIVKVKDVETTAVGPMIVL